MSAHRFREVWDPVPFAGLESTPAVNPSAGFIAFPCPLVPGQMAFAEFLYRMAYAQAQAQVALDHRSRRIGFSIN